MKRAYDWQVDRLDGREARSEGTCIVKGGHGRWSVAVSLSWCACKSARDTSGSGIIDARFNGSSRAHTIQSLVISIVEHCSMLVILTGFLAPAYDCLLRGFPFVKADLS